jgi:glycopeptide antibiotics resistance protein
MASTAMLLATAYPWSDLQDHSHWARVGWVPFVSPPVRLLDVAANLLLGAPIGFATAWGLGRGPATAALIAAGTSVAAEWTQLYSHSRFPSATDVICNVGGAFALAVATRRDRFATGD